MLVTEGLYILRHDEKWLSRFKQGEDVVWGSLALRMSLGECMAIASALRLSESEYVVVPAHLAFREVVERSPIQADVEYDDQLIEYVQKNLEVFNPDAFEPAFVLSVQDKLFGGCYADGLGFRLTSQNLVYPSIAQAFLAVDEIREAIEAAIAQKFAEI